MLLLADQTTYEIKQFGETSEICYFLLQIKLEIAQHQMSEYLKNKFTTDSQEMNFQM